MPEYVGSTSIEDLDTDILDEIDELIEDNTSQTEEIFIPKTCNVASKPNVTKNFIQSVVLFFLIFLFSNKELLLNKIQFFNKLNNTMYISVMSLVIALLFFMLNWLWV
jgi:hypothetical protein